MIWIIGKIVLSIVYVHTMPSAYTTVYEASIPSIIDHTTKKIVSKLQVLLFDQVGHLLKNGIFLKDDLKKKETAYKSVNNVSSEGEGGGAPQSRFT